MRIRNTLLALIALLMLANVTVPALAQDSGYGVIHPGCPGLDSYRENTAYTCGFIMVDSTQTRITNIGFVTYYNGYGTAYTIGEMGICKRENESYFMAPVKPLKITCLKRR